MKKETGRITNVELQRKVTAILQYSSSCIPLFLWPISSVIIILFPKIDWAHNFRPSAVLLSNMTYNDNVFVPFADLTIRIEYPSKTLKLRELLPKTINIIIIIITINYYYEMKWNSRSCIIATQVARVFFYLSAAALQYLAPTILLLFCVLTLRTLGRFTFHSAQLKSDLNLVSIPATSVAAWLFKLSIANLQSVQHRASKRPCYSLPTC